LTGTLTSTEGMYIDMRPLWGAARYGAYRSYFAEIASLTDREGSGFAYPSRGIELEVATSVGSSGVRYEGFFPVQPYRLYPDGWAWLVLHLVAR
jgi:hypothetical protein